MYHTIHNQKTLFYQFLNNLFIFQKNFIKYFFYIIELYKNIIFFLKISSFLILEIGIKNLSMKKIKNMII